MAISLVNPNIVINGETILYEANSFAYKDGFGERKFRAQTAGPGSIENVFSEDIETQKGMCKFTMLATDENVERYRQWQSNDSGNAITASQDSFTRAFNNAAIMTENEVALGSDGKIEVVFESDRAV